MVWRPVHRRNSVQKLFAIFCASVAFLFSADAETVDYKTCHASWSDHELVLGNSHFMRRWRMDNGLLTATSFRNLDTGTEWIREPAKSPAPVASGLGKEARTVSITTKTGKLGVTEEEALEVTVEAKGAQDLICRFTIFPGASGVETFLDGGMPTEVSAGKPPANPQAMGLENDSRKDSQAAGEALENLLLAQPHLRLTQVAFMDRTDNHNELVQENEWLLLNERKLQLSGNLFAVENSVTGEGLVFLKFAPLPHARAVQTTNDCEVTARERQVRFAGQGYPFTLLAYSGGRAGRTVVLHNFQRQLRRYQPERDGMFLSNTWGDRSRDGRVCEEFLLKEIEAGSKLGVDVVQIDDGWQKGLSGNSAFTTNGAWGSFWDAKDDFWLPNPQRFPRGLQPVADAARAHGMKLGLWYGPDSAGGGTNWNRDAERLLKLHHDENINYFKLDAVDISTATGATNFRHLVDKLLNESHSEIALDLDVTAGTRPGYFGTPGCGPIFVENRYTDWPNYWPHLTLRNLWKLSQYVDPLRLRMEFLNNARNAEKYGDDPLAPARYTPDALFATVMFANPLGWFEVSNLPTNYLASVSAMVKVWKRERTQLFSGNILPIGDAPDGNTWTGFASVTQNGGASYILLFRELNPNAEWTLDLKMFPGKIRRVTRLAGKGNATLSGNRLSVRIPETLAFLWLQVE